MSSFSPDSYNTTLTELKAIERAINNDIKELRINVSNSANTFNIENSIRKSLDNYINKLDKLSEEYQTNVRTIKNVLPEKEYNFRLNQIQDLKNNHSKLKGTYDDLVDMKYKHKTNYSDIKVNSEEMKDWSNRQIYDNSQKKLKNQDAQVEEISGTVKKGKELTKELKNELGKQNLMLEDVEKDVDRVNNKMVKTRGKFENYIEKSSTCCIMTVIIVELIALICILLFW